LIFPGAGINVILTCLWALGIYPVATQALICSLFWYQATDFDTFRMLCLFP